MSPLTCPECNGHIDAKTGRGHDRTCSELRLQGQIAASINDPGGPLTEGQFFDTLARIRNPPRPQRDP